MVFVSKSEPRSIEYRLAMFCPIDEKRSIKVMFLSEFAEEPFCQRRRIRGVQPHWSTQEEYRSFRIDSSVQSIAMFVEVNHRLVERDAIRILIVYRL